MVIVGYIVVVDVVIVVLKEVGVKWVLSLFVSVFFYMELMKFVGEKFVEVIVGIGIIVLEILVVYNVYV